MMPGGEGAMRRHQDYMQATGQWTTQSPAQPYDPVEAERRQTAYDAEYEAKRSFPKRFADAMVRAGSPGVETFFVGKPGPFQVASLRGWRAYERWTNDNGSERTTSYALLTDGRLLSIHPTSRKLTSWRVVWTVGYEKAYGVTDGMRDDLIRLAARHGVVLSR